MGSHCPLSVPEQWKAFLELLSSHNFQGSDVDAKALPLVPLFHTSVYNLPFRVLNEKEVIQLSGLKNFWHNVSLSDAELVPEALLRNVCGNCFHPDLISSALGSNDVLKSWVRGEVERSVKHVMNQTEAYTVFAELCDQIEKEAKKRRDSKLQLDKTLPSYESLNDSSAVAPVLGTKRTSNGGPGKTGQPASGLHQKSVCYAAVSEKKAPQACGPILTSRNESCAMWCDNTRLSEELIECHIGSFVQVHIRTHCSDLVRIDLQAALQRSIQTLHLPVHQLPDELVKMKVFVPQGVTCFSSETFDCTSPFEYWQKALTDEGSRVYPRKNPDTMIFHRVHKSIEEICPVFGPSVKHFILGDTDEQAHIRTVIFALFTARYEFIGACHWTPITKVWDILDLCGGDHGWIIYHNNRRLSHRNVEVDQGDFFACYERSNSNPVFMDKGLFPSGDQEWIANRSSTALSSAGDATGDTFEETPPTFESTGDPLLLIGRRGAQRRQDDRVVTFDIDSFQ